MEEQKSVIGTVSPAVPVTDDDLRLQNLVADWEGVSRGEPFSVLHQECLQAVGSARQGVLPAQLVIVPNLDAVTLKTALAQPPMLGYQAALNFRVPPVGRFDAALVPVGPMREVPRSWLLAIEANLPGKDQVALYAHALGHLLLIHEERKQGKNAHLNPEDQRIHVEMLGELRELARQVELGTESDPDDSGVDRPVLVRYQKLAQLLGALRESPPALGAVAKERLTERLNTLGWRGLVTAPYIFTAGRIKISGASSQRDKKLQADVLLRVAVNSLPIALIEVRRVGEPFEEAEQRLVEYAQKRMRLPFGYLLDTDDVIYEYDWVTAAPQVTQATLDKFPTRDALWERWARALRLDNEEDRRALLYPYHVDNRRVPRYYQEAAINQAVITVLQARRGLRTSKRLLLTMATGTGKTLVAFQVAWKLKKAFAIRNILFLTDRESLLTQAMDNDFAPFGPARHRLLGGEVETSRDVIFSTYQALADEGSRANGLYRQYAPDYFDVIVIDECHRGSADDESRWRGILEHFNQAVQIGLTATPRRCQNAETYNYFGKPLTTYSLRLGITDGFLAPYRVHRVLIGPVSERQAGEGSVEVAVTPDIPQVGGADDPPIMSTIGNQRVSGKTLVDLTPAIAEHLAEHLRESSDTMAKTIVFCASQDHALKMRDALKQACWEQVQKLSDSDYVVRIVSDDAGEGKRMLGNFSLPREKTPVIVTTSQLLSTGVDVPTCKNIVLARPVDSLVEFKQIIGRGTRIHDQKTWFTIIDYAGATYHFFDPAFDGSALDIEITSLPQPVPASSDSTEQASSPSAQAQEGKDATSDLGDNLPATADSGEADYVASTDESAVAGVRDGQTDYTAGVPAAGGGAGTEFPQLSADEDVSPISEEGDTSSSSVSQPPSEPEEAPANVDPGQPLTGTAEQQAGVTPAPKPTLILTRPKDGRQLQIIGEDIYELGEDGQTLQKYSHRDYARKSLEGLCETSADLLDCWLNNTSRKEILERVQEMGVNLQDLAERLGLKDCDSFDLLRYVAFEETPLSRRERVERVQREHADFLAQYSQEAQRILEAILAKYMAGVVSDVSSPGLLTIIAIVGRKTRDEAAKSFGDWDKVHEALSELQRLLYCA